jgi:hypothetical protein
VIDKPVTNEQPEPQPPQFEGLVPGNVFAGVSVPISDGTAGLLALGASSYLLRKAGQRMEDAAAGYPDLWRYPKDVQHRVRAEYQFAQLQKQKAAKAALKAARKAKRDR